MLHKAAPYEESATSRKALQEARSAGPLPRPLETFYGAAPAASKEEDQEMSGVSVRPVKRTTTVAENSSRVAGWLAAVPELSTRPALLAYLREHRALRHALFNAVNFLENVALIPDPDIAVQTVGIAWSHTKDRFECHWKGRLAANIGEDNRLWAELHGTLRNVYRNMLRKAGKRHQEYGPFDVARKFDD